MNLVKCYDCDDKFPPFYHVKLSIRGSKETIDLCHNCNNKRMAKKYGVDLIDLHRNVFVMEDDNGQDHLFRIRKKLKPRCIIIEAQEFIDDEIQGYNFEVVGDLYCDQLDLEKDLYEKIKDELLNKTVEKDIDLHNNTIVGMISSDVNEEDLPLLIINGEEYSWQELGRFLTSYEGWNFKLEIK